MTKDVINDKNVNEQSLEKKFYKLDFSKLAKSVITDLGGTTNNILFKNFPKSKVMDAMQNPRSNIEPLRDVSNFLYMISPHYRRLCNYYSGMLTLDWYISPYKLDVLKVNEKQFKKMYNESLFELNTMNIKHEMSKALQIVFREGIFFGYEYKSEDSYFIQKLDPDYCEISSIEDGVFNFKFNFQYFEGNEDMLENYAPEFSTKFKSYQNGNKSRGKKKDAVDLTWQELDSENTICIKVDESVMYPVPPFIGVFADIYELQDYKALKKSNNEMQNYALLSGRIPMNDKSEVADDFKLTMDTALQFGNKITSELPNQVGFMLSVFDDMEIFKLNDDKVGSDKVEEAVGSFWNSTGVSKNLFTDGGTTDAAIRSSLITDEQDMFTILRQIERWINRKLKIKSGKYKFQITMLNTTWQNQKEKVAEELKVAQFGFPNRIRIATSMGMSQLEMESMNYLELDILGLGDKMIPLQSSHTQNGESSGETDVTRGDKGRPTKEEDDVRTDNKGDDE